MLTNKVEDDGGGLALGGLVARRTRTGCDGGGGLHGGSAGSGAAERSRCKQGVRERECVCVSEVVSMECRRWMDADADADAAQRQRQQMSQGRPATAAACFGGLRVRGGRRVAGLDRLD